MKIIGIIPARYASTRFPGKPLVMIDGKSMIQRVYEQALKSICLSKVVVATDDERIVAEVVKFGGEYALTQSTHQSGTDRCAEVAEQYSDFDVVINIQGDEPFIDPAQIDLLASCFELDNTQLATLIKPVTQTEELFNTNSPKVIVNHAGEAIYFSRHPIPFIRNAEESEWVSQYPFFKHIGIYGYRTSVLKEITKLPASALEVAESLEQLRWIENGYKIQTKITKIETLAIDTPEDLLKIVL
ncbi:3-deoxy-manno-octulosonate cytidylyltransferase [Pedobacter punctiformis]|uniref:3-deoxy-manno-octulosonate cytidylyltransferase n=1 Tax=Pedobacter punctiformis TaxID=3004097 RepID=A0ABT4L8C3_9SPHI|nr:3-deoxy-manno-octulosonate cytidylyltransferase [Pedobacter sp. HCMS5-2]MCZ4243947.1 3-deoxy-manno-octulosonate cytidylyltransferase [Pedobacter sp. HCMS5-2]